MAGPNARKKLGELLTQAGVITETQLRAALAEQRRWGGQLGRILVDMKFISEDAMVQALSHQLNFPAVTLETRQIDASVLDLVPGEVAEQLSVIPFNLQGKFLDVAMSDPTNLGIIDELRIRTRLNVRPYLAGPKSIERAIARNYGRGVGTLDYNEIGNVGTSNTAGPQPPPNMFSSAPQAVMQAQPTAPVVAPPGISAAAARRAQQFEIAGQMTREQEQSREIQALQARVQALEALVARDEDVLRKLLGLFIEKGIATREEILDRIR